MIGTEESIGCMYTLTYKIICYAVELRILAIFCSGSAILLVDKVSLLLKLYYCKINIGHVIKYDTWSIDS